MRAQRCLPEVEQRWCDARTEWTTKECARAPCILVPQHAAPPPTPGRCHLVTSCAWCERGRCAISGDRHVCPASPRTATCVLRTAGRLCAARTRQTRLRFSHRVRLGLGGGVHPTACAQRQREAGRGPQLRLSHGERGPLRQAGGQPRQQAAQHPGGNRLVQGRGDHKGTALLSDTHSPAGCSARPGGAQMLTPGRPCAVEGDAELSDTEASLRPCAGPARLPGRPACHGGARRPAWPHRGGEEGFTQVRGCACGCRPCADACCALTARA